MKFNNLITIICITAMAVYTIAEEVVEEVKKTEEEVVVEDNATAFNITEELIENRSLWDKISSAVWTLLGIIVFCVIAVKNAWDTRSNKCGGVLCGPQQFIRPSKTALSALLMSKFSDPKQKKHAKRIMDLLEAVLERKYASVQEQLTDDYDAFDPVCARASEGEKDDQYVVEKRHQREGRLLSNVELLLEKANFVPLTQSVAEFALAEDYILTVPVDVKWEAIDSEMLRYHRLNATAAAIDAEIEAMRRTGSASKRLGVLAAKRDAEAQNPLFEHKDQIMIYHRGITMDITRGKLMSEKIDALTERIMSRAFGFVRTILNLLPFVPKPKPTPEVLDMSRGVPAEECITMKRVRLQNKVLNPANFLLETTVQEPAFEEVFVLWRPKAESDTIAQMALSGLATSHVDKSHFIFAKTLRSIPLADLELVFPEKHIHMKPFDLIMMVSGLCTAAIALVSQLFTASTSSGSTGSSISSLVVTAAVAAVMKTMSSYTANMNYYNSVVQAGLNARTLGNNRCAFTYLVDAVKVQEYKETALALFCLLLQGGNSDAKKLQERCDMIIQEIDSDRTLYPVPCTIQIDDAIEKLQEFGLSTPDGKPSLVERDMEAIGNILEKYLLKQVTESVNRHSEDEK